MGDILLASGILIGLIIIMTIILLSLRKRLISREGNSAPGGFSLHELKQLRARGDLTEEEYNRARDVIIQQAKQSDITVAERDAGT